MSRVAVCSPVPVVRAMGSPGIRAYHLARELARDHQVTVVSPGLQDPGLDLGGALHATAPANLERFDAVVAQRLPPGTMRRLAATRVRTIYDLYTPALGEGLASLENPDAPVPSRVLLVEAEVQAQRLALVYGNAFVCPGERQRDFWLGALGAADRVSHDLYRADRTLRNLIDVVPFGVPADPPQPSVPVRGGILPEIKPTDRVLLWLGGAVAWSDPETVIRAVAAIAARRDNVKLVLAGFDPPEGSRPPVADRALKLAESLGVLGGSVLVAPGWVPYDRRGAYLLDADLGVAAYHDSFEARLAFRARLLDHFWAALPTVTTRGDEVGDLVGSRHAGRAVAAGDADAYAAAVEELLDGEGAYAEAQAAAAELRNEFAWARAVEPLRRLVAAPGAPVPRSAVRLRLELEELRARGRLSYALRGPRGAALRLAARLARR